MFLCKFLKFYVYFCIVLLVPSCEEACENRRMPEGFAVFLQQRKNMGVPLTVGI